MTVTRPDDGRTVMFTVGVPMTVTNAREMARQLLQKADLADMNVSPVAEAVARAVQTILAVGIEAEDGQPHTLQSAYQLVLTARQSAGLPTPEPHEIDVALRVLELHPE